jgi:hypothetical protein
MSIVLKDIKEIEHEGLEWILEAENNVEWQDFENMGMNSWILLRGREFVDQLRTVSIFSMVLVISEVSEVNFHLRFVRYY